MNISTEGGRCTRRGGLNQVLTDWWQQLRSPFGRARSVLLVAAGRDAVGPPATDAGAALAHPDSSPPEITEDVIARAVKASRQLGSQLTSDFF
jgi:hypothetical protein